MALAHVHWKSLVLRKMVSMNVLLPDAGEGPFPVLYLLHGLSDDHTAWCRRSRIEWYARDLPLIIVMPDGGRDFYTDNAEGQPWDAFFSRELIEFTERNFPARRDRGGRCIGGLSMGGYGALRLALAHPELYTSAHSHSGALLAWRYDANRTSLPPQEHQRIFGADAEGSQHDLFTLAKRAKAAGTIPAMRLDCGTDDFLLPSNRDVHKEFTRLGITHEYLEFPGAHEWDYWDLHIRDALTFHMHHLQPRSGDRM